MSEPKQTKNLLGLPVVFTDRVPVLGNSGDLVLLPPCIEVSITPIEAAAIRQLNHRVAAKVIDPGIAADEIIEMLGPERSKRIMAARESGQFIEWKVGW